MNSHSTMPIMINKNQMMNRVLSLLLSFALAATSGCAVCEGIPSLLPNAFGHAGYQAADTCRCDCAADGVPCYGYHPTQWSHWPEWCECPSIYGAPVATPETVFPEEMPEATVTPEGQRPDAIAPPAEPPDTLPPQAEPPERLPPPDRQAATHNGA